MRSIGSRRGWLSALLITAGSAFPAATLAQDAPKHSPTASPQAEPVQPKLTPLDLARLEAAADAECKWIIARGAAPGVCIAVGRAGEVVFARGYGRADIENDVRVTTDSAFRIASVTKQLTAAAIMKLVESGKVKLDEPVRTYLPDTPEQYKAVTIRHLLSHTSGIPDFIDQGRASELAAKVDVKYADIAGIVKDLPLEFEPGSKYAYCNTGYVMLGEVIARVSGVPYREFLKRELLDPLGLTRTGYTSFREIVPRRVRGYFDENGAFVNARYLSPDIPGASGALYSTANDLVKWTHLLHSAKVVSPESLKEMTTAATLNNGNHAEYGLGTQVMTRLGRPAFSHGGNGSGFSAFVSYWPGEDLTVVVLANGREVLPNLAGETVVSAALGLSPPAALLTPEELAQYEGTFTFNLGGRTFDLRVYPQDGNLVGHRAGNRPFRFFKRGEHRFVHEQDSDAEFTFTMNDGRATSLTLKNPRGEFAGQRKP